MRLRASRANVAVLHDTATTTGILLAASCLLCASAPFQGGSKTAGELAKAFDVSKPTMSGHFAKLKEAGLIQADQQKTTIYYSINMSVLEEVLMGFMGRMGAKDGEIQP